MPGGMTLLWSLGANPPPRCRFFLLFFVCFGCFSFLVILAGFSFLLFVFLVKNSEGEAEEEFADENVDPEIELCSA